MISVRPSLQDEILNWFNEISEERKIFCYYNSVASVIPMVEHGTGIAISPESVKSFTSGRNLVYKKIIHPQHDSRLILYVTDISCHRRQQGHSGIIRRKNIAIKIKKGINKSLCVFIT